MLALAPVSAQTLILMLDLTKLSDEDRSTIFSIAAKAQQEGSAEPETATIDEKGVSFPITEGQGRALLGAIDARTKALLRRFAEEYDPETGKAQLDYNTVTKEILFGPEAANIHGVDWWGKFTKGHLSGLHRSLRHITKDPKAVLLVRADTDPNEAAHYIDAPAILVLRELFGIK